MDNGLSDIGLRSLAHGSPMGSMRVGSSSRGPTVGYPEVPARGPADRNSAVFPIVAGPVRGWRLRHGFWSS